MVKKIFIWTAAVFFLFSGGLIAYVYFNQEGLKKQLIQAVNSRLKVPVNVGEVNISPLTGFPDATIAFTDVVINDPHVPDSIFAEAEEISFSFNIWDLLQGIMVLEDIRLLNGEVKINQYTDDKWSYQIYKEAEKGSETFSMDIQNIQLRNVKTTYLSKVSNTSWKGLIEKTDASVRLQGPVTLINLNSEIFSRELSAKDFQTFQNQSLIADAEIIIDKHWRITSKELRIGDSSFELSVSKTENEISSSFKATKANVQTLLSLCPEQVQQRLKNYSSTGFISLSSDVIYTFASKVTSITSTLTFSDVSIRQKDPAINLENLNFSGTVKIPNLSKQQNASVAFNEIKGNMNGKSMTGSFSVRDFDNPYISASYKGEMPLHFLKDLADLKIWEPEGKLQVNLNIDGLLADLKDPKGIKSARTSGEVSFSEVKFYLPYRPYPIAAPEGTLIFNNDHLALNNFELILGRSHFKVNGELRNFWNISSSGKWSATADVHSKALMLDELLSVENADPKSDAYSFRLPSNISLNINATVEEFQARQFKAKRIAGKLSVKDKILKADRLSLESMGGLIKLKGQWHDMGKKGSLVDIAFMFAGVNADSLFYSFENFNQSFITEKNLSGKIYAEAEASLQLDSNLVFQPKSLTASLNTRIVNGALHDFKPLYSLEEYLDDADLSTVQFADLQNQIYVQNEVIHLPLMVVGTNIIKFKIGGSHSFNQHIDYDVVAPLNRKKRVDRDERFGTVAADQHGETLVFLSINGTTSDFEVSLDQKAMKEELASDVKREVKELQDAFKNNGREASGEVVLEEDDYFDWEEEN